MSNQLKIQKIQKIDERYSGLAESSCCLSCGGAVDRAEPAAGEVCVDLGSGRGTDVIRMAQQVGKTGFAYGVDTASGMNARARRTARKMGIENVQFIESTFEKIDLPTDTADLVISNCAVNHATNKDAVWAEVERILKPEGRFVVSDIYATETVPAEYANDPEAVSECWAGAVTKKVYLESLERAGFVNIRILEESAPYQKSKIEVASWTISGEKTNGCSHCCG